jgi:hypothetical protein
MSNLINYTLEDGSQVQEIPANYTGFVINKYFSKFWYQGGKQHRLDGPACDYSDGSKAWYLYDKLHRLDGPAWEDIDSTKDWCINGEKITKQTRIVLIYV